MQGSLQLGQSGILRFQLDPFKLLPALSRSVPVVPVPVVGVDPVPVGAAAVVVTRVVGAVVVVTTAAPGWH